jgi:hypothetical protein
MDLVSFKSPIHLTWCYQTGGWVDRKGGRDDQKQGKISCLDGSQNSQLLSQRKVIGYITQVTVYRHKTLAYICLAKSSLKHHEDDKRVFSSEI